MTSSPEDTDGSATWPIDERLLNLAMRQMIEYTRFGFIITDSEGQVYWANPGFLKTYGLTQEEVMGRQVAERLRGPLSDHSALEKINAGMQHNESVSVELINYTAEGRAIWVDLHMQPIVDEESNPTGFHVAIDRNITRRKLGEALGEARRAVLVQLGQGADLESGLQALVSAIESVKTEMRISVMLLDESGKKVKFVASNRLPVEFTDSLQGAEIGPDIGTCGTAAYTGERVISEDILTDPKWKNFGEQARMSGMRACWSQPVRDVSGTVVGAFAVYYPAACRPTEDDLEFMAEAAELAGIMIDRKKIEDELHAAKVRAEEASLAKSRFLANISHELRTPLNAIVGFSDLIAAEGPDRTGGPHMEFVGEIGASARTLLDLVSALLESARLQQGDFRLEEDSFSPGDVIRACVETARSRAARRGIGLDVSGTEALPKLYADPGAFRKVLTKLLDNALKFSPDGGHIGVSAGLDGEGNLTVTVSDAGLGIPESDVSRVLEPFEQGGDASAYLARKYGGTGLGLAICHSLMQLHGGRVELDSAQDKGTQARLVFPASRIIGPGASMPESV